MNILTIVFYAKQESSPIKEVLDRLSDSQRTKVLRQLKYLQEFGISVAIPNNKKLTGTPLWELRVLGRDNLRIFYGQTAKDTVTILHIFHKKQDKTPQKDFSLALSRYSELVDI